MLKYLLFVVLSGLIGEKGYKPFNITSGGKDMIIHLINLIITILGTVIGGLILHWITNKSNDNTTTINNNGNNNNIFISK